MAGALWGVFSPEMRVIFVIFSHGREIEREREGERKTAERAC